MDAGTLYNAISEVCPILDAKCLSSTDRASWTYEADPSATQPQKDAADNVILTIPAEPLSPVEPGEFVTRFTDAEYLLLEQKKQTDITGGDASLSRIWDIVIGSNQLDFNSSNAQTLKDRLVTDGILTQARADAIFSQGGTRGAARLNWVKTGEGHGS